MAQLLEWNLSPIYLNEVISFGTRRSKKGSISE